MSNITFDNFDKFSRRLFANRLTRAVTTFYPFYNGAYVISLNASFGSGKTSFLQMWKTDLEEQKFKVIYINAWEDDFIDEPLVSIATEILAAIDENDSAAMKAKSVLRGIAGASALVGNAVIEATTNINIKDILIEVKSDLSDGKIQDLGDKISQASSLKKILYSKLKASLSGYLETLPQKPLIVIVDELDRVRPDYAIKFLEAIKHIFSMQKVCFVIGVDRKQLCASVKQLYGDLDFDNYYRRFVVREVNLPETSQQNLQSFMEKMHQEYFERKDLAGVPIFLSDQQRKTSLVFVSSLSYSLELTPRQIEHLFRIFIQFLSLEQPGKSPMDSWVDASIFMIALSISNKSDIYHSLGKGLITPKELGEFLDTLKYSGRNSYDVKRRILWTALAFMITEENQEIKQAAIDVIKGTGGNTDIDRQSLLKDIGRQFDSWGRFPDEVSGFQAIYNKLEEWQDFLGS